MSARKIRLAAVVLAAGAGSRYSAEPGAKLLAEFRARPILGHVLESLRGYAPALTMVVLASGADTIEHAIDWADEQRIRNPHPERGLGSSLKVGIVALRPHAAEFDGTFIVLGDQPLLRTEVLHALADAAGTTRPAATTRPGERPIIVPRYADDAGARNPVLLLRPAWPLVDDLDDERGLGPLIEQHPEMIQTVTVDGAMPDVDTPTDLEALRASS